MKVEWNKKYTTIAIYAFLVISSSIIVYLMASQAEDLKIKFSGMIATMQPFIIGSAIAYIINFILNFYEKVVFEFKYLNKLNRKYRRGIGLLLSYLTAIIVISLFMQFVLPQLVDSIVGLANNIPQYVNDASHVITEISEKFNLESKYMNMIVEKWNELLNYIITLLTNLIPVIGNFIMTLGSSILNIIIGIIVSIYILIDKEKFIALSRKVTFSIFSAERSKRIVELAQRSNETFGKFLSGKILDSLIIGILTFIILTIFKSHIYFLYQLLLV